MAKCFIHTEEPVQGAVAPGGAAHCCQSREGKKKENWLAFQWGKDEKESLLSVVGTYPESSQVALEVSEFGAVRDKVSPEGLRHVESCSEASQRRLTNRSAKY